MNIAIDARAGAWYRGTGVGTYTFQLLRNILPRSNNISPIYPEGFEKFDPVSEESYSKKTLFKDKFWETIQSTRCQISSDIALLHIPHNGMGIYETDAKRIITLHDVIPYVLPDTVGAFYHKIFLEEMPKIVEQAEHIITVSQHSKNDICRFFRLPDEKVDVIYEAPESIYQPMDPKSACSYVSNKYGLSYPYILYIGGFSPRKNVPLLIEAYQKVYRHLSGRPKLVIVGKMARNYKEVLNIVEKHHLNNEVVFTGFIPVCDLPAIYNAAMMFVYPSSYEGFGLPPLEAMACCIPTVCGNNSSIPEVVGDGADMVDVNDIWSIVEALVRIAEDKSYARKLARRGLLRAQRFSWERTAAETLNCYNKILEEA